MKNHRLQTIVLNLLILGLLLGLGGLSRADELPPPPTTKVALPSLHFSW